MSDLSLYNKIAELPQELKEEVVDFIEFLKYKSQNKRINHPKRILGKAKGLIKMKENFDDPIEGFEE